MAQLLDGGEHTSRLHIGRCLESCARVDCRAQGRECLFIPLVIGELAMGYLCLCLSELADEVLERPQFLRAIGHQIGIALRGAQLYDAVHQHREQLSRLTARLTMVEDEQRRQTATDVHDRVGQPLALARMQLTALIGQLPEGVDRSRFEDVAGLLGQAIKEQRAIALELYPPVLDSFGLRAALESSVDDFEATTGVAVSLEADYGGMDEGVELRAYLLRVARELLVNVAKHARATRVVVRLFLQESWLNLVVIDDGQGFTPEEVLRVGVTPLGLGLLSVRERIRAFGGSCRIDSAPGEGTTVHILVPLSVQSSAPGLGALPG